MRVRPTLAVFLSATFLFCTGCRADFGDRAVAWVRDNARRYSHDLADADYAARWASHFTARQRQMTLLAQDIELNSAAVYTSLDEALTPQPDENVYEAALRQRAASRTSLDVLIATRVQIDELEQASADISAACQRSQFDRLGLAQVGSFGVAASFLGMADAVKQANRNRYGIYVGFTVVTDGNGEPMEPAGATEQLTHFARGISIYVEDIAAWLNEEEIEDQTQKVHEAIADFDRRVLRPDDLYVLSRGHCRAERTARQSIFADLSRIRRLHLRQWRSLLTTAVRVRRGADVTLAPLRARAAAGEIGASADVARILDEDFAFEATRTCLVLLAEAERLNRERESATDARARGRLLEERADALYELTGLLDELVDDPRVLAHRERLRDLQQRVRLQREALPAWLQEPADA